MELMEFEDQELARLLAVVQDTAHGLSDADAVPTLVTVPGDR